MNKVLLIKLVCLFCLLTSFNFQDSKRGDIAFRYQTNDAVWLNVYEELDSRGVLKGYTSDIKSPVCEHGLCYDVELNFYWDVLGNFRDFEILPNKPLTKLDHISFNTLDYDKLKSILLSKSPSFIHLRRAELTSKQLDDDKYRPDAVSGATLEEIKNDLVEGAVYTCYTLWHIANGDINFQLQEYTKQRLDKKLIMALLRSNNVESHFFLIDFMDLKYFDMYANDVIRLVSKYDSYFESKVNTRIQDDSKLSSKYKRKM